MASAHRHGSIQRTASRGNLRPIPPVGKLLRTLAQSPTTILRRFTGPARGHVRRSSRSGPYPMMKLSMAGLRPPIIPAMMSLPPSATSCTADVRGDEVFTAMDGNSISEICPSGIALNLYFLAGGEVTYSRLGRANVGGTRWMHHDGGVCTKRPERVEAPNGFIRNSHAGSPHACVQVHATKGLSGQDQRLMASAWRVRDPQCGSKHGSRPRSGR